MALYCGSAVTPPPAYEATICLPTLHKHPAAIQLDSDDARPHARNHHATRPHDLAALLDRSDPQLLTAPVLKLVLL